MGLSSRVVFETDYRVIFVYNPEYRCRGVSLSIIIIIVIIKTTGVLVHDAVQSLHDLSSLAASCTNGEKITIHHFLTFISAPLFSRAFKLRSFHIMFRLESWHILGQIRVYNCMIFYLHMVQVWIKYFIRKFI